MGVDDRAVEASDSSLDFLEDVGIQVRELVLGGCVELNPVHDSGGMKSWAGHGGVLAGFITAISSRAGGVEGKWELSCGILGDVEGPEEGCLRASSLMDVVVTLSTGLIGSDADAGSLLPVRSRGTRILIVRPMAFSMRRHSKFPMVG